jgi:hypothetical protein
MEQLDEPDESCTMAQPLGQRGKKKKKKKKCPSFRRMAFEPRKALDFFRDQGK